MNVFSNYPGPSRGQQQGFEQSVESKNMGGVSGPLEVVGGQAFFIGFIHFPFISLFIK